VSGDTEIQRPPPSMSSQSTTLAAAAVYLDRASLEPPLRLLLRRGRPAQLRTSPPARHRVVTTRLQQPPPPGTRDLVHIHWTEHCDVIDTSHRRCQERDVACLVWSRVDLARESERSAAAVDGEGGHRHGLLVPHHQPQLLARAGHQLEVTWHQTCMGPRARTHPPIHHRYRTELSTARAGRRGGRARGWARRMPLTARWLVPSGRHRAACAHVATRNRYISPHVWQVSQSGRTLGGMHPSSTDKRLRPTDKNAPLHAMSRTILGEREDSDEPGLGRAHARV
jgi:hypothetical protein